jgi:hypothetical protein
VPNLSNGSTQPFHEFVLGAASARARLLDTALFPRFLPQISVIAIMNSCCLISDQRATLCGAHSLERNMSTKKTIQKITLAAVLAGSASLIAAPASAQEFYMSEIRLFASDYCPQYWLLADGAELIIQNNAALFSLLGTAYGGDGRTTFNLPDLRNQVPGGTQAAHMNYCISIQGIYPSRQ